MQGRGQEPGSVVGGAMHSQGTESEKLFICVEASRGGKAGRNFGRTDGACVAPGELMASVRTDMMAVTS